MRSTKHVLSVHPYISSFNGLERTVGMSATTIHLKATNNVIRSHPSKHLQRLENESIEIIREIAAEFSNPVMLYSIGKDSSVMLHLAIKAFFPAPLPFPLLHIDTTWKFREMISFRDETARRLKLNLLVYINNEGLQQGINPITLGSGIHTQVMKTEALKQAIAKYRFDAALGGARRDEEKSRAKERIFSFRNKNQAWDPRDQRPELWNIFNTRVAAGESMRVFPLSNWTELDIWVTSAFISGAAGTQQSLLFQSPKSQ
jgi:sulfate adenylyltransferase subunit 2